MNSPSEGVRVRVDRQGRLVLPQWLRHEIVEAPGEVLMRRTADGVLLTSAVAEREVKQGSDGLPLLRLGRPVSNDDVIGAIHRERSG